MTVKEEIVPSRTDLSGAQRALLEERLKRAKLAVSRPIEARQTIRRRPAGTEVPASFAQQRLWFLDQLEPGSPVYNVCQALRLRGTLDVGALVRALNAVVGRHEALRTNFVTAEGRPLVECAAERALTVRVVDLTGRPDAAAERDRELAEETRRPFDLAQDLLVRALLVRTAADEHTLLLTLHHIISDGWSLAVLWRELAAYYDGYVRGETVQLPELPIQYADYAVWERDTLQGATLDRLLDFWRTQLDGPLPVLELPTDRPRTAAQTSRGAALTATLPPHVAPALKTLAHQEGATLFMALLAAYQVLLHRWTGQEDFAVGSVVAGRREVELEALIGFFVNTLVFRGDLSGGPTFRELLRRTRDVALGVFAHQDLPFERLVNELRPDRTVSRNPLFQTMFVLQNAPAAPANLPRLQAEALDVDNGTSKFDLTLQMLETPDGLRAAIEYNADLFEEATIARLLGSFTTLLESIAADGDMRISHLPLLSRAERERLLIEWNGATTAYPAAATIPELFAEWVRRTPDAEALRYDGGRMTYRELDRRSNRLASFLRRFGVGPDTLVGVSADRGPELIVALLGILKAGGAYVSLDPAYPTERLAFMLADTAAPVLLTQGRLRPRVDEVVAAHRSAGKPAPVVVSLDDEWTRIAAESDAPVAAGVTAEQLAYVSYTSGSTGRPKGVCVPHRGVARLVRTTDYAEFAPGDTFLQFAPIAFDASTFEIWGALANGGRLAICPPGALSLSQLGEVIVRERVGTLWLTAGLFHQMVDEQIESLAHVRQLLAGGDVLSPAHTARLLQRFPGLRLINGYGPTENTTFTCCHRVTLDAVAGQPVPIGRPIANTTVYVLDRYCQPVPVGVAGELYTGGAGLARGYLNRPELTAEKFVPDPFAAARAVDSADEAGVGRGLRSAPEAGNGVPAMPLSVEDGNEPVAGPGVAAWPDFVPRLYRTGDRVRWRADGTIEFLGRIDRQVKIRGFRVEPAEIEAVLAGHAGVKECAVLARETRTGDKRLVAYVVPRAAGESGTESWRRHLAERLPEYLVPTEFVRLAALPLTPNGKVDVRALPEADRSAADAQAAYVAPRDEVERRLVEIWEDVLGVHPLGIHDHFFALGGHSLLAVRMIARLEKTFGKKLPVAAIFQHRTVAELATLLREPERAYASATSLVEIQGKGTRPPLYLVHGVGGGMFWGYANLARHLGDDQPLYAFKSRGLDGLPEWPTIEEMAASYVADLRAAQPHGPYQLGGYCFGGIVAYEMARQLRAQGESVSLLALVNGSPPNTGYQLERDPRSPLWLAKFFGNLGYWLGCFLFRWKWRERVEFVRWKLRVLRRRTDQSSSNQPQVALGDVDQLVDIASYPAEERRLWGAHVKALINYHPGRYDGRVTLIRTRGHPLLCSFDWRYGWGELAERGVDVKIVRGGHGNVLAEPYVASVARALRPCLGAPMLGERKEAA